MTKLKTTIWILLFALFSCISEQVDKNNEITNTMIAQTQNHAGTGALLDDNSSQEAIVTTLFSKSLLNQSSGKWRNRKLRKRKFFYISLWHDVFFHAQHLCYFQCRTF